MTTPEESKPKLTFWQTLRSVLASMLGVQSRRRAQQDFERGNPLAFILVGILVGAGFVVGVWSVVQWVLQSYGL
ncbi:MAG: DUF2970 domain-containing protein [Hahellaceae bacterium]|nr:DUF2970 domain-containing protein [Hahellaceae bacterium]